MDEALDHIDRHGSIMKPSSPDYGRLRGSFGGGFFQCWSTLQPASMTEQLGLALKSASAPPSCMLGPMA
jgi:hypothetical protein